MKNFKFKWLLLSIILSIASINTAWGQSFAAENQRQAQMQSQMMMSSGSSYSGTVYQPFSNTTPSEQSYTPAKAPGASRKGYNPETGEWTPDAPDIETAGDYGQSEESPIGEPWIMALFALAFAGVIAIRQYKRKTIKSMNMKNSTKYIATLGLLLTLGVGQMWGYDWTNGVYIYFDNGNVNWSKVYLSIIKNDGGDDYVKENWEMTRLGNSTIYYINTGYGGYKSLVFRPSTSSWDNQSKNYQNGIGSNVIFTLAGNKNDVVPHWDGEIVRKGTSGSTIYFWNNNYTSATFSTVNFRYGMSYWSLAPAMRREPGTQACYSYTLASDIAYYAYYIANKPGWTDANSIYQPADWNKWGSGQDNQNDANKITGQTTSEKSDISGDIYITPTGTGSTWGGFCQYYNYSTSSSSGCSVSFSPSHGTITVEQYLNDDGSSTEAISSGTVVLPTRKIRISTTPDTGYKLSGTIGVTNATNISAGVYYVTGASVVSATFVPKQSVLTFVQEGDGYASGGQSTTKTATYGSAMPTTISVPTAATGYKFQGYYDGENGTGTKYYNADGSSAQNWDKDTEDGTTLYAYFEKSQLTEFTFSPTTAAGGTSVTITPTITPTPTGTTYICWGFYSDSECTREVAGVTFSAAPSSGSGSVTFTTPAASGVYYVKGVYRTGGSCGGADDAADVLNVHVQSYIVASEHTVRVKYMCDGVEIAPQAEVVVPAAGYKGIKALSGNDVFGYQFSSWSLGDGLTDECVDASTCGAAGKDSIYISAVYNGTLTANYTKKNMIFFKDNLGWTDPENADAHVYVNFRTNAWWDSSRGTGNKVDGSSFLPSERRNKAMNRVPGTTDIFYYEYGSLSTYGWVSFTKDDRGSDQESFYEADTNNPAQVSYPTKPNPAEGGDDAGEVYGFSSTTPMFVPLNDGGQLWNDSHAKYFNNGYWVNYVGEESGYTLEIYNSDESKLVQSKKFTSANNLMSMTAVADLEAGTTYKILLKRGSISCGNGGGSTMVSGNSGTAIGWEFTPGVSTKCAMKTAAAGDYTFLLSYSANEGGRKALRIGITYPSSEGDYRLVYKDRATWSQGSAHSASWYHPSRVISQRADAEDIISFYISKAEGANASLTLQQVESITPSTGAISWADTEIDLSDILDDIDESGVYNFKVTQDGTKAVSVTYDGKYEGNYYIRTDNAGSSKWSDYIALDHQMTYSEYAISSGYTHYFMQYCQRGTNVKFCIANDYSPCISDTLIRDITRPFDQNMDENGFLYTTPSVAEYADKYSANIRFMWNQNTNKISRAYLSSAQMDNILVLTNNGTTGSVMDENDVDKSGIDIKFKDDQNWIYEAIVKVKPSANVRLKVFARYNNAANTATNDQYLIGSYNSGTYDESSSELLLTGTGDIMQTIRILYDFKTSRLVKAWMPTNEIEGAQTIDADLMIVREHQQSAQNILLTELDKGGGVTEDGSLTTDKKIYAVMRFNRWILSNRANPNDKSDTHAGDDYYTYHPLLPVGQWLPTYERSLYYISFPFDVKVSEIFGFGNYGTHYAIQRYDGAGRAKNGYWVDSDPNWKWVPPTGTLNAYEGYVLSLSMSNMDAGNTSVWTNKSSEIELYFPSSTTGTITIQNTDVVIDSLDSKTYKCTIERDKRNIKDSYWRCIGVPSYADYSGTLTDDKAAVINWQKEDIELPFIYEINWQDKSLTPYVGANFPFKAMHSYLVQYGGEIHWTNVVNKPSSIVARERTTTTEQVYRLELSQSDAFCDQTYVRMTDIEGVTNSFDFNHDLSKETNAGRANIWTMTADSVSAAGNSMPTSNQTSVIPVGVKIVDDGDYTISMPEGTNGVGVVLIDNIAGTRTNLALDDYTVSLAAGQYDERFMLEISPMAQTPTGIENANDGQNGNIRKVMVDGILYIVKDGKVFDARGNRIQ